MGSGSAVASAHSPPASEQQGQQRRRYRMGSGSLGLGGWRALAKVVLAAVV